MITLEQVQDYTKQRFNEQDSSDRIEDRDFAYYINTQPREYLDTQDEAKMTLGNGPIVILKDSGDIYTFTSNPSHVFRANGVGVNAAKTADEFNAALNELKEKGDSAATSTEHIG